MNNLPTLKKFKLNQNFHPFPVNEGDELCPNGIFVFNITLLLASIKSNPDKFPLEQIEVNSLRKFPSNNLDESTILKADISAPIILAEISPSRFNVIDGNHRLEQAYRIGVTAIPAYRVNAAQHLRFLTSERAYKAYIDYWNSKIDDQSRQEKVRKKFPT